MKKVVLFTLIAALVAAGCAQKPKQMELCEYYLWSFQKWSTMMDNLYVKGDAETAAGIAREVDAEPAPERAQRYKDLLIERFTAEASHADINLRWSLGDQFLSETKKLDALCPKEAGEIQRLIETFTTATPKP